MSNIRFLPVAGLCGLSACVGSLFGSSYEQIKRRFINQENDAGINYNNGLLPMVAASSHHVPSVTGGNLPAPSIPPVSRVSEIMKFGFPSSNNIISYENFILSYDRRNRNANWVFEHIKPEHVIKNDKTERSKSKFIDENNIHKFFRATNGDFKNSGYDRGHLAAAANHRHSQKAMDQTFILSNISPQVGNGFNRDAWNDLEKYVRAIARKNKNVYCCTGPLYLPRKENDGKLYVKYEVIGQNHVAVPTHFFKVILIETPQGVFEQLSFVMPNQPLEKGIKLKTFLVPVEVIERAAGILLFDKLPKNYIKTIK